MRIKTLRNTRIMGIILSALILTTSMGHVTEKSEKKANIITSKNKILGSDVCEVIKLMRSQYIIVPVEIEEKEKELDKKTIKPVNEKVDKVFKISAYNLSRSSTGKSRGNVGYGLTSSGFNIKGHTLESARTIATDPKVIPTNTRVRLTFIDEKYKKYNNIYIARDVGGGINNFEIDLFFGDGSEKTTKLAREFGVTRAKVTILED